jgi:hypothetical protein
VNLLPGTAVHNVVVFVDDIQPLVRHPSLSRSGWHLRVGWASGLSGEARQGSPPVGAQAVDRLAEPGVLFSPF